MRRRRLWFIVISAASAATVGSAATPPPVAAPGPLAEARLVQITLPVTDLKRSVAFYRDTLGVKFLFGGKASAFFELGGIRLRLEKGNSVPRSGSVELYFDDPNLTLQKPLAARGVKFVGPPETVQRLAKADVQLLEFTDPDGNALALMGEVPRP